MHARLLDAMYMQIYRSTLPFQRIDIVIQTIAKD